MPKQAALAQPQRQLRAWAAPFIRVPPQLLRTAAGKACGTAIKKLSASQFGYMWRMHLISEDFFRGWFPIFTGLCVEIDRILGEYKSCFHWVQIKEKFGVLRLYFDLEDASEPLRNTVRELVLQAQRESAKCCMVCGEPASLSRKSAWLVTVCPLHEPDEVSKRGGQTLRELMQEPVSKRSGA